MSATCESRLPHQLHLPRGAQLKLRDAAGTTVSALDGFVWITEEDNPRDIVLQPGQSFRLASGGLSMVEALSSASISISFMADVNKHRLSRSGATRILSRGHLAK